MTEITYVPTATYSGHAIHAQRLGYTLCGRLGYPDQATHLTIADVTCAKCRAILDKLETGEAGR
jgi:hypothetical protein